ncbi:polysaccharide deacetylase family protein [Streptosporangium sp. G11]|uniref:polysaccharide deacetylase family protein n=1 Tax=Streptosporangium sp. G11 TaxID=3436926 RepID=UPI003EBEC139
MILRGDPAGPLAVPAALSGGSMRGWRVWAVPVVLLLTLWERTSPIALVGSVEPATVVFPAIAGPAGFERPVPSGSPGPQAPVPATPGVPVPTAGASGAGEPSPYAPGEPVPTTVPGLRPGEARPRGAWEDLPVSPRARRINCVRIKCVALTFDDGPGAYTGPLLDILAGHRARATFFVVGRMVSGSGVGILRRMVAEGHELGNHTWAHPRLPLLSQAGIREELGRTQWIVKQVTGVTMILMRPPYGLTDDRVAAESRQLGLAQIMWDVDTLDWRDQDSEIVAQRGAEAEPGSVVLMHDIHATTVQAVPRLLDRLAARGFRFVTLSELYGGRPEPGRKYYGSP